MSIRATLLVTWGPDQPEDPRPVVLRYNWFSRLACWVVRHQYFALRRTVRTNVEDAVLHPELHAPSIRHELRHVWQQARDGLVTFLRRYWFVEGAAAEYEADAKTVQDAFWPQWRVVS
jgi:hypothetical protein